MSTSSTSRVEVTQSRLKGPPGAVRSSSVASATGKVSVSMKVENISYDHWISAVPTPRPDDEPKDEDTTSLSDSMDFSPPPLTMPPLAPLQFEHQLPPPAATAPPGNVFKNNTVVEVRTSSSLCDPADAFELDALKRELDFYKLHTQVLLQTKSLLEEKLNSITNDFEDFKEAVNKLDDTATAYRRQSGSTNPSTRKSSSVGLIPESPDDELRYSLSPPIRKSLTGYESGGSKRGSISAFHSAVDNLNFGVSEEFKRAVVGSSSSSPPLVRFASAADPNSRPAFAQRRSLDSLAPATSDSHRLHHFMLHSNSRPYHGESNSLFYRTTENDNLGDTSPISEELCRHFLKGRCRYKRLCKFSHEVAICPYCSIDLPQAKIAASTHLSRCYKAHGKPGSNNNNLVGSFDDDQDDQDQEQDLDQDEQ